VLIKSELDLTGIQYTNMIINQDPLFVNYQEDDYQLQQISPAVNAGDPALLVDPVLQNDLLGNPRTGNPDLGAYEFQ
jgi:hypothetical protein